MKINWFPGHMHKALKEIKEELKKVDVVLYVLDARIPLSSLNPKLNELSENKPVLYILNKIDIADEKRVGFLKENFKGENKDYILYNSNFPKNTLILDKI